MNKRCFRVMVLLVCFLTLPYSLEAEEKRLPETVVSKLQAKKFIKSEIDSIQNFILSIDYREDNSKMEKIINAKIDEKTAIALIKFIEELKNNKIPDRIMFLKHQISDFEKRSEEITLDQSPTIERENIFYKGGRHSSDFEHHYNYDFRIKVENKNYIYLMTDSDVWTGGSHKSVYMLLYVDQEKVYPMLLLEHYHRIPAGC